MKKACHPAAGCCEAATSWDAAELLDLSHTIGSKVVKSSERFGRVQGAAQNLHLRRSQYGLNFTALIIGVYFAILGYIYILYIYAVIYIYLISYSISVYLQIWSLDEMVIRVYHHYSTFIVLCFLLPSKTTVWANTLVGLVLNKTISLSLCLLVESQVVSLDWFKGKKMEPPGKLDGPKTTVPPGKPIQLNIIFDDGILIFGV